ncbi:MAG: DUF2845 domain-containing protein [Methylobacillus sp.]|jgi:hypothetical protein|nr:DUF2845 domain-containing protein [Methylobacillus sp.]
MKIVSGVLFFISLIFMHDATAQTLRCDTDSAKIGDSKSVIEMKCGAPVSRDNFCKRFDTGASEAESPKPQDGVTINVEQCEPVEEWTYNPGSGQFLTIPLFRGGVLESIKYGPRIP